MRRSCEDDREDGVCCGWGRSWGVCWEALVVGCLGGILVGGVVVFLVGDRYLEGEGVKGLDRMWRGVL